MTPDTLILWAIGSQLAGLVLLGTMVYRQSAMLGRMGEGLGRLAERVSPGEAAILLEARKHHEVVVEIVRQALANA